MTQEWLGEGNMSDCIEWEKTRLEYAQPNSLVDIGEMYYWACKWHEKHQATQAEAQAEIEALKLENALLKKLHDDASMSAFRASTNLLANSYREADAKALMGELGSRLSEHCQTLRINGLDLMNEKAYEALTKAQAFVEGKE